MRTYIVNQKRFPSVHTILQNTKSKTDVARLTRYNNKLSDLEKAELEVRKVQGADRGSRIHKVMQEWIRPIMGMSREKWIDSLSVLEKDRWTEQYVSPIKKYVNRFIAIEYFVWHDSGYAGTLDTIVQEVDGTYALYDWKTSFKRKKKDWVLDYRHQVAAYIQAFNQRDKDNKFPITRGRIFMSVQEGKRASIFSDDRIDLPELIDGFNTRVNKYYRDNNLLSL